MMGVFNKYCMSKFTLKLDENEYKIYSRMLMEDVESDSQKLAIKYAIEKCNMNKDEATDFIKNKFRMEIQYLNGNRKAGKFTLGAFRLYMEITTQKEKLDLNNSIEKICNDDELYKKYNKNLNGLDLQDLVTEVNSSFKGKIDKSNVNIKGNYKIIPINSFSDANSFKEYVDWCVAHYKKMYDKYTLNGTCKFYFILRNDFKELDYKNCEDEKLLGNYGTSMFAVCVYYNGDLKTCTCRWNHDKGGNDHILSKKDIISIIGPDNAEKIFVPDEEYLELQKEVEKVNSFESLDEITDFFDTYKDITRGKSFTKLFYCQKQYKYDFINYLIAFKRNEKKTRIITDSFTNINTTNFKYLCIDYGGDSETYDVLDRFSLKFIRKNINLIEIEEDYITYNINEEKTGLITGYYGIVNEDKNGEEIRFDEIMIEDDENLGLVTYDSDKNTYRVYNMVDNIFLTKPMTFEHRIDSLTELSNNRFFAFDITYSTNPEGNIIVQDTKKGLNYTHNFYRYYRRNGVILTTDKKYDDLSVFVEDDLKLKDGKIIPNCVLKNVFNSLDIEDFTIDRVSLDCNKYIISKLTLPEDDDEEQFYTCWTSDGKLITKRAVDVITGNINNDCIIKVRNKKKSKYDSKYIDIIVKEDGSIIEDT